MATFDLDDPYYQFTISRCVVPTSSYLSSTLVYWVPVSLIDDSLMDKLNKDKIKRKLNEWHGHLEKTWVDAVMELAERETEKCFGGCGRSLHEMSGKQMVYVTRQFFSCEDY